MPTRSARLSYIPILRGDLLDLVEQPLPVPSACAFLPSSGEIASRITRRSLKSSSGRPSSSAILKATLSTPSCTSLRSSSRDSSSGPISVTVARIGWPCSPNRSQKITGNWSTSYLKPMWRRARPARPSASPISAMPERSPLMSAANTGTPARANPSARTCNVTVLPVPVAPVTRPWRLASDSVRNSSFTLRPTKICPAGSACAFSGAFALAGAGAAFASGADFAAAFVANPCRISRISSSSSYSPSRKPQRNCSKSQILKFDSIFAVPAAGSTPPF